QRVDVVVPHVFDEGPDVIRVCARAGREHGREADGGHERSAARHGGEPEPLGLWTAYVKPHPMSPTTVHQAECVATCGPAAAADAGPVHRRAWEEDWEDRGRGSESHPGGGGTDDPGSAGDSGPEWSGSGS